MLVEAIKEAYDAKEAYRYEKDGVETVGWYFAATLRQPFEYAGFPFDEQDLWLRMWSRDFPRRYCPGARFRRVRHEWTRRALPGIEREFVYCGWTPVYSGFSFSDQPYSTSFGIGDAGECRAVARALFQSGAGSQFRRPVFRAFVFALAVAVSPLWAADADHGRREPQRPLPAQHGGRVRRRKWTPFRGDSETQPNLNAVLVRQG